MGEVGRCSAPVDDCLAPVLAYHDDRCVRPDTSSYPTPLLMSDTQLDLRLDDPDATYRPGEEIAGTAVVSTDAQIDPTDIQLELEWFTEGKGSANRATVETVALQTETVESGETAEYRFALETPPGPFSYEGEMLAVNWRLRATLDSSVIGRPTAEAKVVLEPGPTARFDWGGANTHEQRVGDPGGATSIRWGTLVLGLVFALVPPIFVFGFAKDVGVMLVGGIGVVIFSGGGLYFVYASLRNAIAGAALGDVDLEVRPEEAVPGDTLDVTITIEPDSEVAIEAIRPILVGRERVEYHDANDETPRERKEYYRLHEGAQRLPEAENASLAAGQTAEYTCQFDVPADAPTTFHAPSNDVEWQVELEVAVPNWPDLDYHKPVVVRPPTS